MTTVERSVEIPGDADAAWAVLADFGDLARWTRPVQHCWLVSDQTEGIGATRRVQVARMAMIEEIVTWDPERALGYTITGLPPIVRRATNTWTLTPAGAGTRVTLTSDIDTGSRPPLSLVSRAIAKRLAVASELMVADLATEVARRAEAASPESVAEAGA
ncbi:MAG: SRPBCC family protein [Acidimicrobiales bacterium]